MRVLQVIPSLAAAHGGPSAAARTFERALAKAGCEVLTLTTDDDGPGRRMARPLCRTVVEDGAARIYFPKRTEFYKVAPESVPWLARNAGGFDVIHVHALFSFTSTAACWAARHRKVPYVLRPLGTISAYSLANASAAKRVSLAAIEGRFLRHAAAVHFTSDAEEREAGAAGLARRSVVIPLGVPAAAGGDAARFGARHPQVAGRTVALYLSRLDPKKNLEGLLRAWAGLAGARQGAILAIAGDGDPAYVGRLHQLAGQLGLADDVAWLGHLDGADKADAFAAAAFFVLASFSENFGIAAAEALAAGVPCVLGEGVAIAADVAGCGAGIVTGTGVASIASALRLMMASDHAAMRDAARRLARERFSEAAMGQRLRQLYLEILSR